jgi:uncharacterized protein
LGKLVLLLLVLVVVYAALYSYRKRVGRHETRTRKGDEDMVRCEHCGVHLPRSESLLASGKFYCSPEHQAQRRKVD